ncbi:hypothetical protein PENTCL1PPCAC_13371, partial [Pristionchus entomophagus]
HRISWRRPHLPKSPSIPICSTSYPSCLWTQRPSSLPNSWPQMPTRIRHRSSQFNTKLPTWNRAQPATARLRRYRRRPDRSVYSTRSALCAATRRPGCTTPCRAATDVKPSSVARSSAIGAISVGKAAIAPSINRKGAAAGHVAS